MSPLTKRRRSKKHSEPQCEIMSKAMHKIDNRVPWIYIGHKSNEGQDCHYNKERGVMKEQKNIIKFHDNPMKIISLLNGANERGF